MSKYTVARRAIASAVAAAPDANASPAEVLEALIVLAVAELAAAAGPKRVADTLRYELSNVGGEVDTVFLRSR